MCWLQFGLNLKQVRTFASLLNTIKASDVGRYNFALMICGKVSSKTLSQILRAKFYLPISSAFKVFIAHFENKTQPLALRWFVELVNISLNKILSLTSIV